MSLLLSSSLDGTVILWDLRKAPGPFHPGEGIQVT